MTIKLNKNAKRFHDFFGVSEDKRKQILKTMDSILPCTNREAVIFAVKTFENMNELGYVLYIIGQRDMKAIMMFQMEGDDEKHI